MSFATETLDYHFNLSPEWNLPPGVEVLFPYAEQATRSAMEAFYLAFYDDARPRIGLFGINPGRHGAGITGIPFTDPVRLENEAGIPNGFAKRPELSSLFVYEVIRQYGGLEAFCRRFYISSLSPLGFVRAGKNYNYYDDEHIRAAVTPHILTHLRRQVEIGVAQQVALCLGRGQNLAYFRKVNEEQGLFGEILPLPHPRWVMQYRRKHMDAYVGQYLETLARASKMLAE